jgi:hypothetical protein
MPRCKTSARSSGPAHLGGLALREGPDVDEGADIEGGGNTGLEKQGIRGHARAKPAAGSA